MNLLQVIFCSRTHSQLSQTVAELHRTLFADSTTAVSLASRKVLPWLAALNLISSLSMC